MDLYEQTKIEYGTLSHVAQSTRALEYIDCISAKG